jgi:hypothetical protein
VFGNASGALPSDGAGVGVGVGDGVGVGVGVGQLTLALKLTNSVVEPLILPTFTPLVVIVSGKALITLPLAS